MDLFELGQQEFGLAVVVVAIVNHGIGRLVKIQHGEVVGPVFFSQGNFQGVVDPEVGMQMTVDLPAELVIPGRGGNTNQMGTIEKVLHQLILIQLQFKYRHN